VQAAKAKWDTYAPRKHKLTFEDLFEYFKVDCVRQNAVAVEAGLTRERIRQIYNKYFRELFDGKSGRERMHACTLEKNIVKIKQAESTLFETDVVIKAIVEKAREAGCKIEAVPQLTNKGFVKEARNSILVVNGHLCSVHNPTARIKHPDLKRVSTRTSLSRSVLSKVEASIFHTTVDGYPEHTFVVPTAILLTSGFSSTTKEIKTFILPMEKSPVPRGCAPRIDYWQYENAWHLLPPKQNPLAP
jgi:hypothetical protein